VGELGGFGGNEKPLAGKKDGGVRRFLFRREDFLPAAGRQDGDRKRRFFCPRLAIGRRRWVGSGWPDRGGGGKNGEGSDASMVEVKIGNGK